MHEWRAISGTFARPADYFKQPGYHIAVHVRRGDVGGDNYKFADDHIYINMARTVQAMLPNGHVHIFSTTFDHFSKTNTYNGITIHNSTSTKVMGFKCTWTILRSMI